MAAACPSCGHTGASRDPKAIIAIVVLAGFGALLYYSGFAEAFMSGFDGHPGLPGCDSAHGQADVRRAVGNGPVAKSNNITVVAITVPESVSITTDRVECKATAILNSGMEGPITYSFAKDPAISTYYVRASVDLASLKQHQ